MVGGIAANAQEGALVQREDPENTTELMDDTHNTMRGRGLGRSAARGVRRGDLGYTCGVGRGWPIPAFITPTLGIRIMISKLPN